MSLIRDSAAKLFASDPTAADVGAAGFDDLIGAGATHADLVAVFMEAGQAGASDEAVAALGDPTPLNRAALVAGAAAAMLDMTMQHVNTRVQFGKPLAKQQAVQQQLAVLACEVAAVTVAVQAAAAALDAGLDGRFEALCAKLRANLVVPRGTSIAHQLHGAIGFTTDYPLHKFSLRLNRWRRECGTDTELASELGKLAGGDAWGFLTSRSDQAMGDRSMSA